MVQFFARVFVVLVWIGSPTLWAIEPRPNIVLIISDDQGAGDYGFMGHPQVESPHLDRLAAQSLTFRRGFVPTSLCCPSLATIISGKYPHQHRITANDPPATATAATATAATAPNKPRDPRGSTPELNDRWNAALDDIATLPRMLSQHGYLSFQTGKWWHGSFARGGFTHGMTMGTRHGDSGLTIGREGLKPMFDFIATAQEQNKPFLVWYAPFMPHTPHTPPKRLFEKYQSRTDSPHVARYWAMCEWFDETCGELLAHLDQKQLSNNTIVVYVTDNGWIQSPKAAGFAPKNKTTPYDSGHRTPMTFRWPGTIQPQFIDTLASSIDIVPTLLSAMGIEKSSDLPGIDLFDSRQRQNRSFIFGENFTVRSQTLDDPATNLLWRWVTDGRWRLIIPRTAEPTELLKSIPRDSYLTDDLIQTLRDAQPMLFDLEADPQENNNVALQNPEMVAKLRDALDRHWKPIPIR